MQKAMPRRIEEDERAERLLTAKDAGNLLRLSESWLAKARMRGDGPPYRTTDASSNIAERHGMPDPVMPARHDVIAAW